MATLLNKEEIFNAINSLDGWSVSDKSIKKSFKFKDFVEAFSFITKVAFIAESLNHHPNLKNSYSNVEIELTSHDLGGICDLDIEFAIKINAI